MVRRQSSSRSTSASRARPTSGFSSRKPASANVPQSKPTPAAPEVKQPGLLAQAASTAVGVGVGSALGHAIGHSLVGGSSGDVQNAPEKQELGQPKKCEFEWESYMRCMNETRDDQACKSLMDKFKYCSELI